jgi:hypothetical protein
MTIQLNENEIYLGRTTNTGTCTIQVPECHVSLHYKQHSIAAPAFVCGLFWDTVTTHFNTTFGATNLINHIPNRSHGDYHWCLHSKLELTQLLSEQITGENIG